MNLENISTVADVDVRSFLLCNALFRLDTKSPSGVGKRPSPFEAKEMGSFGYIFWRGGPCFGQSEDFIP